MSPLSVRTAAFSPAVLPRRSVMRASRDAPIGELSQPISSVPSSEQSEITTISSVLAG